MRLMHCSDRRRRIQKAFQWILVLGLFTLCSRLLGCTSPLSDEEKWGFRVTSVRLSAADLFIDFRYQITDPQKASALLDRANKAYLIDQATGKELPVTQSKLGPMRSTTVQPQAERQYVILFTNQNKVIRKGSKVTLAIGEFRKENLTVE